MPKLKASPKAVILVGGPGTRLQPLTYDTPKSMVPILNKPFMEYTFTYLKQYGIKDIILTLSYLPEVIQNYFGDGRQFGVRLTYCVEENPMGTAGAVKNAEQYLNSIFVVLNGDIFTDLNIADMLTYHRHKRAIATISLNWVDDVSSFGVVEIGDDYRLIRFLEKPSPGETTSHWVNAGTYILEPEIMRHIPPNSHFMFEKGLFPLLIGRGEAVFGYPFKGYWLDMGNAEKYLSLNCDLLLSKTSSPLFHGSRDGVYCGQDTTIHPSANIVAPVIIGNRCQISQGVYIKGPAIIGPDCHLEEDASIENTVLWDSVHIGAGARLSHCIISSHTCIEPDSRLVDCVVTPYQTTPLSQKSEMNGKF